MQDNVFLNHSGALGNYGLFTKEGDFVLTTAKTVYCNQNGNRVSLGDLKKNADKPHTTNSVPFYHDSLLWKDYLYFIKDNGPLYLHKENPFVSNFYTALNLHEFTRHLTLLNIGEPSFLYENIYDYNLQNFAEKILFSAFDDSNRNIRFITNRWDEGIDGDFFVVKVRMELKKED